MKKNSKFCLFFILSSINSFITENSLPIVNVPDFSWIKFELNNEFIVFKYTNSVEKIFNSAINFIFYYGQKSSTKIYIYDSIDNIKKGDNGFTNYLYETSLKDTNYFKISYDDSFYKDKTTYYIVLYDSSQTFSDYIYVVNSLNYLSLEDSLYYRMIVDFDLLHNFIIQKSHSTYLHFQGRGINTILSENAYYFIIKNEKGDTLIDIQTPGLSDYVKIDPNVKYYVQVLIGKRSSETEFMLNFEKYGANILLEEGKEKKVTALYAQYFTFFKDISNLSINDTIKFKVKIDYSSFHTDKIYIKYYESSNFENLVNKFPSNKNDFDSEIGSLNGGGNFNYILKKIFESQKSVLIGVFIEEPDFYWKIEPTNIYISTENEEEKKDESDSEDKKDQSSTNKNSYTEEIVLPLIFIIIVIIIVYCKTKNPKCECEN